jgi:threonylcarbamoyladenosine tRNA methylthiotransferase MtaB
VLGNAEKLTAAAYPDFDGGDRVAVNDIMAVNETAGHLVIEGMDGRTRAFVEGPERLRPPLHLLRHPLRPRQFALGADGRLVDQVRALVEAGYAEVVLTGVDITAYGADLPGAPTFGRLSGAILRTCRSCRACASPPSIRSRSTTP